MAGLLSRLLDRLPGGTPDGQAGGLEGAALVHGEALAQEAMAQDSGAGPRPERVLRHPRTITEAAVAQKVLHGWMQNRYQTRYPLVMNLANHSPAERALLENAARYALGQVGAEPADEARAASWLASVGGALPAEADAIAFAALARAQLGPNAYAVIAKAVGRQGLARRRYLQFMAARLGIPDAMARSLNRRFA